MKHRGQRHRQQFQKVSNLVILKTATELPNCFVTRKLFSSRKGEIKWPGMLGRIKEQNVQMKRESQVKVAPIQDVSHQ